MPYRIQQYLRPAEHVPAKLKPKALPHKVRTRRMEAPTKDTVRQHSSLPWSFSAAILKTRELKRTYFWSSLKTMGATCSANVCESKSDFAAQRGNYKVNLLNGVPLKFVPNLLKKDGNTEKSDTIDRFSWFIINFNTEVHILLGQPAYHPLFKMASS